MNAGFVARIACCRAPSSRPSARSRRRQSSAQASKRSTSAKSARSSPDSGPGASLGRSPSRRKANVKSACASAISWRKREATSRFASFASASPTLRRMPSRYCSSKRGEYAASRVLRLLDRSVGVFGEERQQGLGESRQVPEADVRLLVVRIAPGRVDRAEHLARHVLVQERAGAVVDRLAHHRHVVRVHHAVDEADEHPTGDQVGLRLDHLIEEGPVGGVRRRGVGVSAGDHEVRQRADVVGHLPRMEVLEGPDTDVGGGDAREDGARLRLVAVDGLARRQHREGTGGRDPERMHRFAEHVFTKHRAQRRPPIAAAGERCPSRLL